MQQTQRWPIDYDALEKGSIIPVQRLEEVTGHKYGTDEYSLSLLDLKCQVEKELALRGHLWAIRTEKGSLKVLTDAEAVSYTHAEQLRARVLQAKRFAVEQAIDVANLDADQLKQHERNVEINGKYMQAAANVRKELKLESTKRTVPGLPQS